MIGIGLLVIKNEGKIESGELIAEMSGIIKQEKIMEWINGLSSTQRIGLKEMCEFAESGKQQVF